jgi:Ca-activated chloride channel family protein
MTVKLRYKKPDEDVSKLIVQNLIDKQIPLIETSENFRFSAAVAEFGLLLRNSEFKQRSNYQQVINMAKGAKSADDNGYRSEFVELVRSASSMDVAKK